MLLAGWLKHDDHTARHRSAVVHGGALLLIAPATRLFHDDPHWPMAERRRDERPVENPLTGAAIAAFPAIAVVATLLILQDRATRRDMGSLAAAAVFLIAVAVTLGAIRGYSYAIWLGMPMVAAMALRLFAALRLKTFVARLAAGLALTPLALSSSAITIALAAGLNDRSVRPAGSKAASERAAGAGAIAAGDVATDELDRTCWR